MERKDIQSIWTAYQEVQEKKKAKMDPVDADELDGDHKDREDKDIDNDGDEDKSDEYLHNRRKAIKKAMKKEEVEELDELSKKTLGSYVKKAAGNMAGNAAVGAAQASSSMKQSSPDVKRNIKNRMTGIAKATDKLTKEEVELDEAQGTAAKYAGKKGVMGGKYTSHDRMMDMKNFNAIRDKRAKQRDAEHQKQDPKHAKAGYAQHMVDTDKAKKKAYKRGVDASHLNWRHASGLKQESTQIDEDITKMSHGRLKFHMNNKHVPHGSYSWDQMKAERDRRLKTGQGNEYKAAKSSMSEAKDPRQSNRGYQDPNDKGLSPGGKQMKADMQKGAKYDDTEEKGHQDAAKFGKKMKASPMRNNDNSQGDKNIIPSATKVKEAKSISDLFNALIGKSEDEK